MPSVPKFYFAFPIALILGTSIVLGWLPLLIASPASGMIQAANDDQPRPGHLIKIRLPIDDRVKNEVRTSLEAIVKTAPLTVRLDQRAIVVLEFDTRTGKTGRGSDREACQSLARTLTDRRFNPLQTIAYIPTSEAAGALLDPNGTSLNGHAVLVALATNRLALAPNTSIGNAGIDEPEIDELLSTIYRTLPGQRRRLPEPMVASMLDPALGLARIIKQDKSTQYVGMAELKAIEAKELLEETKTLASIGERADQKQKLTWSVPCVWPKAH